MIIIQDDEEWPHHWPLIRVIATGLAMWTKEHATARPTHLLMGERGKAQLDELKKTWPELVNEAAGEMELMGLKVRLVGVDNLEILAE